MYERLLAKGYTRSYGGFKRHFSQLGLTPTVKKRTKQKPKPYQRAEYPGQKVQIDVLEIVRALATRPKLLLLDEPAAGMNPSETSELMDNIVKIRDTFQIAIMLIEHDMNLVMGICEGICVLNFGQIIAKGTADDIQNNPEVIKAYLGSGKEG